MLPSTDRSNNVMRKSVIHAKKRDSRVKVREIHAIFTVFCFTLFLVFSIFVQHFLCLFVYLCYNFDGFGNTLHHFPRSCNVFLRCTRLLQHFCLDWVCFHAMSRLS